MSGPLSREQILSTIDMCITSFGCAEECPDDTACINEIKQARESLTAHYRQHDALVEALRRIAAIKNDKDGGDWDEIEDARLIARDAVFAATGEELAQEPGE